MARILLFVFLFSASAVNARTLICQTNPVDSQNTVLQVNFDPATLLLQIESPTWKYAGHVTIQTSKVTDQTFLTLPAGRTLSETSIEVKKNGDLLTFSIDGRNFECK